MPYKCQYLNGKVLKIKKSGILEIAKSICYTMPRQNDISVPLEQQNPHEVRTRGGFYSVWARWLMP